MGSAKNKWLIKRKKNSCQEKCQFIGKSGIHFLGKEELQKMCRKLSQKGMYKGNDIQSERYANNLCQRKHYETPL
jgi:hypothetical protein